MAELQVFGVWLEFEDVEVRLKLGDGARLSLPVDPRYDIPALFLMLVDFHLKLPQLFFVDLDLFADAFALLL